MSAGRRGIWGRDRERAELAAYLRARRSRLQPIDVDLVPGRRRRTPGLRREEVAELAGVSSDWYTWLEQGRAINASPQVLGRLAEALRLSLDERRYLFALARRASEDPATSERPPAVSPGLRQILDGQGRLPASLEGRRTEILAWNRAAESVFGDFAAVPEANRTWLKLLFTDTPVRHRFPAWEAVASDVLETYRAASTNFLGDPSHVRDVAELSQVSDQFRRWWSLHGVTGCFERRRDVLHPTVGLLSFEVTALHVHGSPDLVLCLYTTPPGSETWHKLGDFLDGSQ